MNLSGGVRSRFLDLHSLQACSLRSYSPSPIVVDFWSQCKDKATNSRNRNIKISLSKIGIRLMPVPIPDRPRVPVSSSSQNGMKKPFKLNCRFLKRFSSFLHYVNRELKKCTADLLSPSREPCVPSVFLSLVESSRLNAGREDFFVTAMIQPRSPKFHLYRDRPAGSQKPARAGQPGVTR